MTSKNPNPSETSSAELPTVEEHAQRLGLDAPRKAFARALVFAHAGYAAGQRVSPDAFEAALAEALSIPLRSGARKGS